MLIPGVKVGPEFIECLESRTVVHHLILMLAAVISDTLLIVATKGGHPQKFITREYRGYRDGRRSSCRKDDDSCHGGDHKRRCLAG